MTEKEISLVIKDIDGLISFLKKKSGNKYEIKDIKYKYFEIKTDSKFYIRIEEIRNRAETSLRQSITYKYGFKTTNGINIRKEFNTEINDIKFYTNLFKRLGLVSKGVKHKTQYKFLIDQLDITINNWKELKPRVEIEGNEINKINAFAMQLKSFTQ